MDPRMIAAFLVAIAFQIFFPLLLGLWLSARLRTPWRIFWYGAAVFGLFQVLTRVPAMQIAQILLRDKLLSDRGFVYFWIFLAAVTAGLFEEGGRYLGYRVLWKKDPRTWENSLMYGAGHGGLESMLLVAGLAILSLISNMAVMQLDPSILPVEQAEAILKARQLLSETPWWTPLLGGLERLLAMPIQICLSVMVLQVFVRGQRWWWWLALSYHALVDLMAGLLQPHLSPLQLELAFVPVALLSLGLIFWLRPRTQAETVPAD